MLVQGIVDCEVVTAPTDPWYGWEGGRGVRADDWNAHPELLDGDCIRFSFGGYLVRGGPLGERVALIDCGNGPDGDDFLPPGHLPDALRLLGVSLSAITDILITHLHYDHTGWLATNGQPSFPNATVHVAAADVAWFTGPEAQGRSADLTPDRLRGVESQISTFDGICTPVPGITALPAPGHTPGSTVYVASEGSDRFVFLGDTVHCPIQLLEPEWAAISDVDPVLAALTRQNLQREIEGASVAGAHFPGLSLGRVIGSTVPKKWVIG